MFYILIARVPLGTAEGFANMNSMDDFIWLKTSSQKIRLECLLIKIMCFVALCIRVFPLELWIVPVMETLVWRCCVDVWSITLPVRIWPTANIEACSMISRIWEDFWKKQSISHHFDKVTTLYVASEIQFF